MISISSLSISKNDFVESSKKGRIPPVFAEIPFLPPASVYPHFAGPMSFLFESVRGPAKTARYSFIGFDPYMVLSVKDNESYIENSSGRVLIREHPLRLLDSLCNKYKQQPSEKLPPFQGGAAGLICYDFVHYLEKLPVTTDDDLNIPDTQFMFVDKLIAFDHLYGKAWLIVCPGARNNSLGDLKVIYDEAEHQINLICKTFNEHEPLSIPSRKQKLLSIRHDVSKHEYIDMVKRTKEYIAAGDIFQANISLRVSASLEDIDNWGLYLLLRDINPSPFACYMDFGSYMIVGSSPERLVKVENGIVETRPIAGTRPRGRDTKEDDINRADLMLNEKERAEHIMLIDLERNDIGRVCDYGSIGTDELMITEDYSHVIHIVSNIRGRLASGKTLKDVIRATFPGGTITGVPKVRCMEIIDELERFRRGPYTGSAGYLGFSGNMDLNIIIRTFTIQDAIARVQAGAGIVADSDPEREYAESLKKAEALLKTLELAGKHT